MLEALAAPEVPEPWYDKKTTGVFLILPDEGDRRFPGRPVFQEPIIRTATAARMKICMLIGPWNVAEKKMKISTGTTGTSGWR